MADGLKYDAVIGMVASDAIESNKCNDISNDIRWLEEHGFCEVQDNYGETHYRNDRFNFDSIYVDLTCDMNHTIYHFNNGSGVRSKIGWECSCRNMNMSYVINSFGFMIDRIMDRIFVRNHVKIKPEGVCENYDFFPDCTNAYVLKMRLGDYALFLNASGSHPEDAVRKWCDYMARAINETEKEVRKHSADFWNRGFLYSRRKRK